ncbi:response regulator [Kaistella antarctica]|uniref:CAI-1 autoinducer sensor kinase/phosphatase CqsS n=1 Tax=Kaistella antarctica TaxID=266748 RepID=A0A448NQ71_9FLAO|nr:response regulator [Kaistella antarctica]KEY19181.1 response regulator receiver protein [Kaistella antarctica]SEW03761.1 two-component system, cell cycle response regulator DivK [Kaistella antarctica]VEH98757.1 CAI-1 autoinducer sensor kinase/phosphatase CqsS [Kaistella antarctica]
MTETIALKKSKKIFIFDDNLEILELCTEILEDLGCQVNTSATTNSIEKQVTEFMPDLIFMDNWLPDMSGIEATRLLKANYDLKNIPVIYFSANSNISELAAEAGADDFIAKPFDIDQFENIVQKYVGGIY